MALRLDDEYVWDCWTANDGARYHLFFLKAPRSAAGPPSRHARAVIGHATSADLTGWRVQPDALRPSPGTWDDLAHWTGSVVRDDDGAWWMFYTAVSTGGHGLRDQRIGVATSPDLATWTKRGTAPVVQVDGRWYQSLDVDPAASETWRDPFVFQDPSGRGWHMLVTARALGRPRNADGVLAHATSDDLLSWTVHGPITEPAGFGQLEVAQVRRFEGRWLLLFTCHPEEQTAEQIARFGLHSAWSVVGEAPLGPWDLDAAQPVADDADLFAPQLVQRREGDWVLLGFRDLERQGIDALEIIDPIPVHLRDGRLMPVAPATTKGAAPRGAAPFGSCGPT